MVTLTNSAIEHFNFLLTTEPHGTSIKVDVTAPQTPNAELLLTFCPPNMEEQADFKQTYPKFNFFLSTNAQLALTNAIIDFITDHNGSQLSITAPCLYKKSVDDHNHEVIDKTKPLMEQVIAVINQEINPALAMHNGMIKLIDLITENEHKIALVKFGGGCRGCSMVNITLTQGITKTLQQRFPEIIEVRDVTAHHLPESCSKI